MSLVDGETIVLVDGYPQVLSGSARGGEQRAIEEPQKQVSIRGPKDGFTESIRTNTALLRRRIKSTDFRMETKKLGKETQTDVSILYINGIAKDKIVLEVRDRISGIDVGSILEAGNIEELIEDETFTTFPTVYHTERLDVFFMVYLILGGFFKISIFFYAVLIGTAKLFKFKDYKKLTYPFGILILLLSMPIASSYPEHIKEGTGHNIIMIHIVPQMLPLLLLVIAYIQKKIRKNKEHKSTRLSQCVL
ncbi:GerAB/ArcD/ProY family transporter [Priestia endophytica]|uniref:GerAB/ArcD/ProY family transporter n=1 Tax=Priestia endophytica TaxID=135735 RepID=UPI002E1BAB77|nr:GerAB/ArcD/ProY family transporter [Priestia endophytica]MED4073509.1 GerAB/ArcD/ProY family transporter [Priestia endophytica]